MPKGQGPPMACPSLVTVLAMHCAFVKIYLFLLNVLFVGNSKCIKESPKAVHRRGRRCCGGWACGGWGGGGAGSGFSRWHVALGLGLLVLGALCTASTFSEPRRHSPHPSVAPLVHSAEFGKSHPRPRVADFKESWGRPT